MSNNLIFYPLIIPLLASVMVMLVPKRVRWGKEAFSISGTALTLLAAMLLFRKNISCSIPWSGFGIDFSLKLYQFNSFIMLFAAALVFLVTLYSTAFLSAKTYAKQFYVYLLLSLFLINGALLSDNLILMLFFWEGLLITLFAMIAIGKKEAFKTATKAFIIIGICDLCMMVGMALTAHIAGTLTISKICITSGGIGGLAFILLMIGAISKAGSMPFHSWIPDAAIDAPLPFMAIFPAALEKLLGIYFLTRISLDMFKLDVHSWASTTLMTVGAITIVLAVMMALVQKDYKRLLSYHAISQVGYMILGIGTLVPAGIVGGIFHMINNALYKSGLFMTSGAVEKQTGTTDLAKLGGLGKAMPITFACFIITALSISGVPPFNGFFSKELVYDGALERGMIFYIAAIVGSFLTAASFLKLGHSVYLGKKEVKSDIKVKEAPIIMLVPMITIAAVCIIFGLWNSLPIKGLIQPVLSPERLGGHNFSGMPSSVILVVITLVVLVAALLNHIYGFKRTGKAIRSADHIRYAPGLKSIYDRAEKRYFDPYNIGMGIVDLYAKLALGIDKAIDWVYNNLIVSITYFFTDVLRRLHTGSYRAYIAWSLGVGAVIVIFLIRSI